LPIRRVPATRVRVGAHLARVVERLTADPAADPDPLG
jgi:hypothetical protein